MLEYIAIDELKEYKNNARTHSPEQIEQLVSSIQEFGFTNPILIDENNVIIAGHGRLAASLKLGYQSVPAIRLANLSEDQKKALRIADNKLALNAGWDEQLLAAELKDIELTGFDMSLIGFSDEELQNLLSDVELSLTSDTYSSYEEYPEDDDAPEVAEGEPITQLGYVWQLGRHRLICGDCTDSAVIDELMQGEQVDLYLTDPPYNVNYKGQNGMTIANDNLGDKEFYKFLQGAFKQADKHLKPGGSFYIWYADAKVMPFRSACDGVGWQIRQNLIWNKHHFAFGRFDYQVKHEPCLYGWKSGGAHNWYSDRKQTTVLDFNKPTSSPLHPTMKPVALISYLVDNSSQEGDLVFDSFGGSGTTLVACEQLGRTCYMSELDPKYCDVIVKRWEEMTGQKAELLSGSPLSA